MLDIVRGQKPTAVGGRTAIVVVWWPLRRAGYISPMSAIALAGLAAIPSYFALILRTDRARRFAWTWLTAHGRCGTVGALLSCIRAEGVKRRGGGALFGNPGQLGIRTTGWPAR